MLGLLRPRDARRTMAVPRALLLRRARTVARFSIERVYDAAAGSTLADDVRRGLGGARQWLPPQHLYGGRRLVAFLGSTIGNFSPWRATRFLRHLAALLRRGELLLVGADLVKPIADLEAAYDDAAGLTAAFNRNVLAVINRELDADFDPGAFDHVAFFDRRRSQIEMHLR